MGESSSLAKCISSAGKERDGEECSSSSSTVFFLFVVVVFHLDKMPITGDADRANYAVSFLPPKKKKKKYKSFCCLFWKMKKLNLEIRVG
jgi:hypothetical protein